MQPRTWGIGGWIWSMCMKGWLFSITVRCCVIFTASSEPMQRCPLPNLRMREWTACKSHCLLSPASPTLLLALRPSDLAHLQTSIFSCDSIDEVLQRKEEACERVFVSERGVFEVFQLVLIFIFVDCFRGPPKHSSMVEGQPGNQYYAAWKQPSFEMGCSVLGQVAHDSD